MHTMQYEPKLGDSPGRVQLFPIFPSVRLYTVSLRELVELSSGAWGISAYLPLETVHIWKIKVESEVDSVELQRPLSKDERKRVSRMATPLLGRLFMASRTSLRCLLSLYTGDEPGELRFSYNKSGKPEFKAGLVHFNISHSRDLALMAFSRSSELGVDLEKIKPVPEAREIARSCFSRLEARWIAKAEGEECWKRFLRCWVIREACVKALGVGLSLPLNSFGVCLPEMGMKNQSVSSYGCPFVLSVGVIGQLLVHEFVPEDGYLGALAVLYDDPAFSFSC